MVYEVNDKIQVVHPVAVTIYNIEQISINTGKMRIKCIVAQPDPTEDNTYYTQKISYVDKLLEDGKIILNPTL